MRDIAISCNAELVVQPSPTPSHQLANGHAAAADDGNDDDAIFTALANTHCFSTSADVELSPASGSQERDQLQNLDEIQQHNCSLARLLLCNGHQAADLTGQGAAFNERQLGQDMDQDGGAEPGLENDEHDWAEAQAYATGLISEGANMNGTVAANGAHSLRRRHGDRDEDVLHGRVSFVCLLHAALISL